MEGIGRFAAPAERGEKVPVVGLDRGGTGSAGPVDSEQRDVSLRCLEFGLYALCGVGQAAQSTDGAHEVSAAGLNRGVIRLDRGESEPLIGSDHAINGDDGVDAVMPSITGGQGSVLQVRSYGEIAR